MTCADRYGRIPSRKRRGGLTLVEILLAMGLLSVVMTVVYMTFATALRAWRSGTRLSENLNHADAVMEPLVTALRSAYYADTGQVESRFGFHHHGTRFAVNAADRISWVKIGGAFLGSDSVLAATPHRIEISVEPERRGEPAGLWMRTWRIDVQPEDFDPETVDPILLSARVEGFQCRMLDPEHDPDALLDDLRWLDDWQEDQTNRLPRAVELTLWVRAAQADAPFEVVRIVELPLADLSWNPRREARRTDRRAPRAEPRPSGPVPDSRPAPRTPREGGDAGPPTFRVPGTAPTPRLPRAPGGAEP